jgi:hypothetical protein
MASKGQKQLAVLGVLAVGLGFILMTGGGDTPAAPPRTPSNPTAGTTGARQQGRGGQVAVTDIELEALKAPRDDAPIPERNLFRFVVKAPPPAPAPRRVVAPPPRPVPTGPPVPQGPPPPPPIPLRFIGLLNAPAQAGRVAILSDGRGNVLTGREGDIIEGRYRLLKIGADSVEMTYTDGRGRQVIRLTGQ